MILKQIKKFKDDYFTQVESHNTLFLTARTPDFDLDIDLMDNKLLMNTNIKYDTANLRIDNILLNPKITCTKSINEELSVSVDPFNIKESRFNFSHIDGNGGHTIISYDRLKDSKRSLLCLSHNRVFLKTDYLAHSIKVKMLGGLTFPRAKYICETNKLRGSLRLNESKSVQLKVLGRSERISFGFRLNDLTSSKIPPFEAFTNVNMNASGSLLSTIKYEGNDLQASVGLKTPKWRLGRKSHVSALLGFDFTSKIKTLSVKALPILGVNLNLNETIIKLFGIHEDKLGAELNMPLGENAIFSLSCMNKLLRIGINLFNN